MPHINGTFVFGRKVKEEMTNVHKENENRHVEIPD